MLGLLCRLLAVVLEVRDGYLARVDGARLVADVEAWLSRPAGERTP